ncbi:MAG: carboxypeptidase-like regulatory domain-containing protein [Bryobacteraceae bacterium]
MVLLLPPPILSQTFGEITGHVTDSSGASVPLATTSLTNTATNAVRTAITTDAGDYSFPSVPPGTYNVKVEHSGFKAAASNGVIVQVQQSVRLDFTLQVGELSQSVEIAATADLLQSENSTVGTVIGNRSC